MIATEIVISKFRENYENCYLRSSIQLIMDAWKKPRNELILYNQGYLHMIRNISKITNPENMGVKKFENDQNRDQRFSYLCFCFLFLCRFLSFWEP